MAALLSCGIHVILLYMPFAILLNGRIIYPSEQSWQGWPASMISFNPMLCIRRFPCYYETVKLLNRIQIMAKKAATSKFMAPVTPSEKLATIVGPTPIPRTEVTKKLWAYIKKNKLQDSKNKRNINADDKLKPIFKKDQVTMFEMTKLVSKHLS